MRPGIFSAVEPSHAAAAAGVAMVSHECVISHRSALPLHGLPLVGQVRSPELTTSPGGVSALADAKVYRATLRPEDVVAVAGVRVTSVARTLVDVARHAGVVAAVAAIDAALHREAVTPEEITEVLAACRNWPRIKRARRAVELADRRAESPLESMSRLVIGWLGVPAPTLQVLVFDADGAFLARVDFYWDEFGVFGEADGRLKYEGNDVLVQEKLRQESLEDTG